MAEHIEREALLEDIENTLVFSGRPDHQNPKQMGARMVVQRIRCAPAADVAPVVHGRWVSKDSRCPFSWRYCSECGYHVTASMARNYKGCPICLARMDGENVGG